MIRDFMDALRRGRDEAIAEHVRRSPFAAPLQEQPAEPPEEYPEEYADGPAADTGQHQARIDELESAMRAREAECEGYKLLLGELADHVDQHRVRIAELEAAAEPLVAVLRLPGVETWLRTRFHPDKYPDANADQQRSLNEATKSVNAAYTAIRQMSARGKDQPT